MPRTFVINTEFEQLEAECLSIINGFDVKGEKFGNQDRNSLKTFRLGDMEVVVKSFRIPNVFNQLVYRFFRKSKARRSFEHANLLITKSIGTPLPLAFYEEKSWFLFGKSYYISEHIECDLTYRELTENHSYPDHENILRAFTRFTFELHENEIEFMDHSPGNTLIRKSGGGYDFYLVDLNRMRFRPLSFEDRIKNFSRLTPHKFIVEIMSDEYAKCMGEDREKVFELMWRFTSEFQEKYWRKQRMKSRLKFWKKQV